MITTLKDWTKRGKYILNSPDGKYEIQKVRIENVGDYRYYAYDKSNRGQNATRLSGPCLSADEAFRGINQPGEVK